MGSIRRAFRYGRPYWKLATAAALLTILGAGLALLTPWPLKLLIDHVLQDRPLPAALAPALGPLESNRTGMLLFAVLAGLLVTLLRNGLGVAEKYVGTSLRERMVLDLRSDLFRHTQRLSLSFHDQRRTGDYMARISTQARAVGDIPLLVPQFARSALTLVGMFWIVAGLDAPLALAALLVVPFLYYSTIFYARRIEPRLVEVKEMEGQSLSIVHEALSMLRVIVAFCREDYEHRRFRDHSESALEARVSLTVRQTLFSLAVDGITAVGTAVVLGMGAHHVMSGRLTVGELLVILSYIAAVYGPLQTISYAATSMQDQLLSLRRALEILDTEPEVRNRPGAVPVRRTRGRIVFDDVHFSYPGRVEGLAGISFTARPGETVAIVGPTGAGKTTLLSLIPRLHDPARGRILLDGADLRDLTVESVRERISLVLQEPLLFSGTIADNIRYGRLDAGVEEVEAAARAANAHDFITRLPEGYDTVIGESGARLSGGERQRVCIARAFLKDAPVLLLDEPTSAIDSRTEAVILDALERLMRSRTTFVVAHRLSTVREADLILVLEHGRLVEQGRHEELLLRGALYRKLHDAQEAQARKVRRPDGEGFPRAAGGRRAA